MTGDIQSVSARASGAHWWYDAENQTGLTSAGDKINSIQTELSKVSPYTMVVSIAGRNEIQISENGQPSLVSLPYIPALPSILTSRIPSGTTAPSAAQPQMSGVLTNLVLTPPPSPPQPTGSHKGGSTAPLPGDKMYRLRTGIPRVYKTEQLPLCTDALLLCVKASIGIDDRVFSAGLRESVKVTKKAVGIFDSEKDAEVSAVQARLSDYEIGRRANGVLFDAEYLHPKQLLEVLMQRLQTEFDHRGIPCDGVLLPLEHENERVRTALALYVRRIVREIGALAAVLGGLDMLVFTAGIGENNAELRRRVCVQLGWLGLNLDQDANASHAAVISTSGSRVLVGVEPTNEEWIAASQATRLLAQG